MAITEIYVDPSIAADSGAGTIGDPYGDLEYAIVQTTYDTVNGTRFNLKAGTAELLAADLYDATQDVSVSIAYVPVEAAPLIVQGYTAVQGDGGVGEIDGQSGNYSIFGQSTSSSRHVQMIDLHCHSTGTATIIDLDSYSQVNRCEVHGTTSHAVRLGLGSTAIKNYVYDYGANDTGLDAYFMAFNFISNGASLSYGANAGAHTCIRNIFDLQGAARGILAGDSAWILGNSVYSDGTVAALGIFCPANTYTAAMLNNVVEGFSFSGSAGIEAAGSNCGIHNFGGNSVFNCATEFSGPTLLGNETFSGNEILTVSPFTDAANRDFSPVDTGSVKEGSVPQAFPTV